MFSNRELIQERDRLRVAMTSLSLEEWYLREEIEQELDRIVQELGKRGIGKYTTIQEL